MDPPLNPPLTRLIREQHLRWPGGLNNSFEVSEQSYGPKKLLDLLPLTEEQQVPPVIALQAHTCARCTRIRSRTCRVGMRALSEQIIKNGRVVYRYSGGSGWVQPQVKFKICMAHGVLYIRAPLLKYLATTPRPIIFFNLLYTYIHAQHRLLLTCHLLPPPPPARNATAQFAREVSL